MQDSADVQFLMLDWRLEARRLGLTRMLMTARLEVAIAGETDRELGAVPTRFRSRKALERRVFDL